MQGTSSAAVLSGYHLEESGTKGDITLQLCLRRCCCVWLRRLWYNDVLRGQQLLVQAGTPIWSHQAHHSKQAQARTARLFAGAALGHGLRAGRAIVHERDGRPLAPVPPGWLRQRQQRLHRLRNVYQLFDKQSNV